MAKLEFGIWDSFGGHEMARSPVAADIYGQHIKEVQLGEKLGYHYYFIIEHQNSNVGQITAPSVYLSAVAQHTSSIRIGTMIYQLPLHTPVRLAEEAATLDHLQSTALCGWTLKVSFKLTTSVIRGHSAGRVCPPRVFPRGCCRAWTCSGRGR